MNQLNKWLVGKLSHDGKVVIAMSGGVDSCLLAAVTKNVIGDRCCGVTIQSELTVESDVVVAKAVADEIGMTHTVIQLQLLDNEKISANMENRCYYCKQRIFDAISTIMPGYDMMDGTNADDDPSRPGRRAAKEFGVTSPLLDCGLGKDEIRQMALDYGLSNWDRVSESCLATRMRLGTALTADGLNRVQLMESFFHKKGILSLRVYHDNLMATVVYLPQYSEIIAKNCDSFAAFVKEIGLLSCEFKEYAE
jgi:uncharacterized protein